ncbi:hypothetical protein R3P38DRAFT_3302318 [Favolaschia claudopus]|uniref:Uncharacterized protein n=1 Tax=Favolaschia claudopus TaxID=2862362 RepID=A0AAW0EI58_9AGAR
MHDCPPPCDFSADTKRGLGNHQRTCPIYNGEDSDSDSDAAEKYEKIRAAKRQRLQDSVAAADPPPAASPPPDENMMMQVDEPPPEPLAPSPPPPDPPVTSTGRPARKKRPTWKLLQLLPEPAAPAPLIVTEPDDDATPPPAPTAFVWESIKTAMNSFGLYREYPRVPTHDPDGTISLEDLSDIPKPTSTASTTAPPPQIPAALAPSSRPETHSNPYHPFPNSTAYGITNWMWSGSPLKSMEEGIKLMNFLKSDAFRPQDLACFNLVTETERLDRHMASGSGDAGRDGWKEVNVNIEVPDGKPHSAAAPIPLYTVPGLFLRPLSEVIRAAMLNGISRRFHFTPFKQFHKPHADADPSRVYDEIYSSDAMIEAYEKLQRQPPEPGCSLERVVLALMWWSDSTHLASFGNAALWPLYLLFGNQSKWVRGKPRANACHHVAYIPKLPDEFHDWYTTLTGEGPSSDVLAHCRRELMHAVWAKILDEDFMDAYEHGIVIECHDGVLRRFYPRFFTYSADYPEKVLLTGIRNLGSCPCPRCKISKDKISGLGTKNDTKARTRDERKDDTSYRTKIASARRHIYELGKGIKSAVVERILSPQSLVPTLNTFSERFSKFGFNFYKMFAPDFLHEFELGVFKSVFTHLIRILVAHGGTAVQTLNARYRMVPPFGRAVIRRFGSNASAMKKMAARNFEDLLQCAIPVFENLLPEPHNKTVLDLLFNLAEWHALGKLRMHTTPLIARLSEATSSLGRSLRYFTNHTCSQFDTRELPKEEAARGRRNARKKKTRPTPVRQQAASSGSTASNKKTFNLDTYKLHALGDYIHYIPFIGTSDSWSTQTGELEHRRVKRFYARTNKNTAVRQMTVLERREQALAKIARTLGKILPPSPPPAPFASTKKQKKKALKPQMSLDFAESESLPYTSPEQHHHISHSRNFYLSIPHFLSENRGDPAVHNFLPKLKNHVLSRLAHPDQSGEEEFSAEEQRSLLISSNRLYRHKILRVNYTTYDVRQGQDSMNPRRQADVMTLGPEDDTSHPFSYCRVLGIFHVDVVHNVTGASKVPTTVEVLWVRRFRRDTSYRAGFKAKRLHRLQFLPGDSPDAFGFLNPDEVIRGVHLIPAFAHGRTHDLLRRSSLDHDDDDDEWEVVEDKDDPEWRSLALENEPEHKDGEWWYHYVNTFVDRDMYMRYLGGGIGHYKVEVDEEPELPEGEKQADGDEGEEEDEPPVEPTTSTNDVQSDVDDNSGAAPGTKSDESDSGSEPNSSETGSEGGHSEDNDEEDFGPEDGEGFVDEEDEEGYAPL